MGYQLVYDKLTSKIIEMITPEVDLNVYYTHYEDNFKDNIDSIIVDNYITNFDLFKVIENELIRKSDEEIEEILRYGHILTEKEKINILLKPSPQEVAKAENTIEMLSMLQEVGLI